MDHATHGSPASSGPVRTVGRRLALLLAAAHGGPALAVTAIAGMLAVAAGVGAGPTATVAGMVLAGQLTIGWGNDLLDAGRDREVGRCDKPLVAGELPQRLVVVALLVATAALLALSLVVPWPSAAVHLGLGVAWGHLYNAGMKSTALSWLPYGVAFGSLPAVASLAGAPPAWPPWWLAVAAAALGVAAHLLNALPDLVDDAATGVQGLPHRLGAARSRVLAVALLVVATATSVLGPGSVGAWAWAALGAVVALVAVALAGRGRRPFQAAVGIALVDVALLVGAGRVPG